MKKIFATKKLTIKASEVIEIFFTNFYDKLSNKILTNLNIEKKKAKLMTVNVN